MLSREEIDENTSKIPFREYSEIISENYISRSARLKCIELEYENACLREELEKYKLIACGDMSVREEMNAELYDPVLNESDIVFNKDNRAESLTDMTARVCSMIIEDKAEENILFLKRDYSLRTKKVLCSKCKEECSAEKDRVKRSLHIFRDNAKLTENVFYTYRCKKCGAVALDLFSNVKIKENPLEDGIITAETIAALIKEKYIMHRSLISMELYWRTKKLAFDRQMMSSIITAATDRYFAALYQRLKTELLKSDFIIADSAQIQTCLINEKECKSIESKAFDMFVYRTSETDEKKIVIFDADNEYDDPEMKHESVRQKVFLKDYDGIIHTDKTELFETDDKQYTLIPMWSGAERLLGEAVVSSGHLSEKMQMTAVKCIRILQQIKSGYDEESGKNELRLTVRRTRCEDLTDELKEIAQQWSKKAHQGGTTRAFEYITKYSDELELFYYDIRTTYDNEICLEELSGFTADGPVIRMVENNNDYRRTVIIMSILRTIKANGLDPERYLSYYLKNMANPRDNSLPLLPWEAPSECRIHMLPRGE